MARCPSEDAERYEADREQQAEEEAAGQEYEKISKKMLAKWNQATGCPHKSWQEAARCYYKYTGCGPHLHVDNDRIIIGSIVEGVDWATKNHILKWPFTVKQVRRAMQEMVNEADEIWYATHGCLACGVEDEYGYIPINPKCKTCKGEGTII